MKERKEREHGASSGSVCTHRGCRMVPVIRVTDSVIRGGMAGGIRKITLATKRWVIRSLELGHVH